MWCLNLYDVLLSEWRLCSSVWYPSTCMMSAQLCNICHLSDVWFVWCLLTYMISAHLSVVCSAIWWLPICMMSPLRYNVSLPNWMTSVCLPPSMMSTYLYGVCLAEWCLSNYAMPEKCLINGAAEFFCLFHEDLTRYRDWTGLQSYSWIKYKYVE